MQPLGHAIRARRTALGMTLGDVAVRSGCAPGYLSQIENSRRDHPPTPGLLRRLERALDLPAESLVILGQWERAPREIRAEMVRMARIADRHDRVVRLVEQRGLADAYASGELGDLMAQVIAESSAHTGGRRRYQPAREGVRVPVLNLVRDGYPDGFTDLDTLLRSAEDHVEIPGVDDPGAIAIRIVGDAMEPQYLEGDIVVCEPALGPVCGDDRFVRLIGDEPATFRRVYTEGATVLRLQPVNCRHASRIVDRQDVASMHRAVRLVRQLPVA